MSGTVFAEIPAAIIGGQKSGLNDAYAAIVSPSGVATTISGDLPIGTGIIYSVAINDSGAGVVGGKENTSHIPATYAVILSPLGVATRITGEAPTGSGELLSVAINSSGTAIIGGHDVAVNTPYAALVSPTGIATKITGEVPVGNGELDSVAINKSGAAIIGGRDNNVTAAYGAVISPTAVATKITADTPMGGGIINSVAINDSGVGIIGGWDNGFTTAYAALVSPQGVAAAISGELPTGNGMINSVAINESGAGIIGGQESGNTLPYAAIVSPIGVATKISGDVPSGNGSIYGVAINDSGAGIVGSQDNGNTDTYAVLVSPSGVVTRVSGDVPTNGNIQSVAINNAGAAVIGGGTYVALVSPSGIATSITGDVPIGAILSVGITSSAGMLASVVPTTFGPGTFGSGSGFAGSLFALSAQILSNRLSAGKNFFNRTPASQGGPGIGLLADTSEVFQKESAASRTTSSQQCFENTEYSVWIEPFGNYAHQDSHQEFPSNDNWIAGAIAAFDYRGIENTVIGIGIAYAFNYTDLGQEIGHAKTNQEFLSLYASWIREKFYVDFALWGGIYQMDNTRYSVAGITSESNIDGWLLNPHLEISSPFYAKEGWLLIDPFAMFDYANNWQGEILETGPSGFNLIIGNQYTSILRSEVGLRVYETIQWDKWGIVVIQQKASWVNKIPFHTQAPQAIFVGGISSFAVELFSNQTQNLGALQLNTLFYPCDIKAYCSLNYQGEFGPFFQNHFNFRRSWL